MLHTRERKMRGALHQGGGWPLAELGGKRVFCNPPYGRELPKWIKKAHDEAEKGALVVMLIPARTDTRAFHDYIYHQAEIRFLRGRIRFVGSKWNAPFPSMVVIFEGKTDRGR